MNMNEQTLSVMKCPQGHDVRSLPSGGFYCVTCGKDYAREELKEQPVDRSNFQPSPWVQPSRYGRID